MIYDRVSVKTTTISGMSQSNLDLSIIWNGTLDLILEMFNTAVFG